MPTGTNTIYDNEGRSVPVTLTATVTAAQVAVIESFLGVTVGAGESGDTVSLRVDHAAYQFSVPASLSVSKGTVVYVDVTDITGHSVDETAYYTASGANRKALFKAVTAKDANNTVIGILLPDGVL